MSSVIESLPQPLVQRRSAEEELSSRAYIGVEVHRSTEAVLADWAELEALAPASIYQTRAFLLPWLETLGAARKISPFFIVARDQHGRANALFCLGLSRHGPFRAAVFLGGKESNFNLGLFRPGVSFCAAELRALLREAARALGREAPDLFILKNQPHEWAGLRNPLAQLPHRPSPSFAYGTRLSDDATAFFAAKLSKDTRKKLRKKEARLAELGSLAFITNDTPQNATRILDAFFAEKIRRCEEKAIVSDFTSQAMRSFFDRMAQSLSPGGKRWLELSALALGERIIATYAGAAHRGWFSAMVNSFDTDPQIAKSSPGDLLLMKLLAAQCGEGRKGFDLGIGEARYKETYCDETVPLFDIFMPLNAKGLAFAGYQALGARFKTAIKKNPNAFALLRRIDHFARGGRAARASEDTTPGS